MPIVNRFRFLSADYFPVKRTLLACVNLLKVHYVQVSPFSYLQTMPDQLEPCEQRCRYTAIVFQLPFNAYSNTYIPTIFQYFVIITIADVSPFVVGISVLVTPLGLFVRLIDTNKIFIPARDTSDQRDSELSLKSSAGALQRCNGAGSYTG